jgi:hypothetical protein
MNGFYAPYIPGWDTHGLPIETALTKNKKVNRKAMSIPEFRKLCEEYALKQVEKQKLDFKRLGILGDWDNPYLTLNKEYEAEQIRIFGKMVAQGLDFQRFKTCLSGPLPANQRLRKRKSNITIKFPLPSILLLKFWMARTCFRVTANSSFGQPPPGPSLLTSP